MGWVIAASPYTGSTFLVHLMIADVVNDQHGYEFWMSNDRLAQKARLTRQTVNRAIGQMVGDGALVAVGTERCGNVRYRFDMPSTGPCAKPEKVVRAPSSRENPTSSRELDRPQRGISQPQRGARPAKTAPKNRSERKEAEVVAAEVSANQTAGVTAGDTKQKRTQRDTKEEGVTNGDTHQRVLSPAENARQARKARNR
jgi:hypothetical protein